ncbi:MAG: phytanoyl-CoA dioxygenase family protein [Dehalococcoidia bacterium]
MPTSPERDIAGIKDLVEDTEATWKRIREHALEPEVAELAALGYTVIPPEKVGPMSDIVEAREAILALAEKEGAAKSNYTTYQEGLSYELYHLVKQGRIFEKLLVNPAILALGRYLLGERMILNNSLAYVKTRTDKHLAIHSDTLMVPDPLPDYLHLVNFSIVLTDYSLQAGCIGIVPGSHRCRRHPTTPEERYFDVMRPIECPAGSVIVIPGNTWHGAFPKRDDGFRVTLVQAYSRQYLAPSVTHRIDPAIIARNSPEFARLLGGNLWTGFDEKGLDLEKFGSTYRSQRSVYA